MRAHTLVHLESLILLVQGKQAWAQKGLLCMRNHSFKLTTYFPIISHASDKDMELLTYWLCLVISKLFIQEG